jgi:hypothetical protein
MIGFKLHFGLAIFLFAPLSLRAFPFTERGAIGARAPSGSKPVIIQMFEWKWDSIATECRDFIGPAGYGFVQGAL